PREDDDVDAVRAEDAHELRVERRAVRVGLVIDHVRRDAGGLGALEALRARDVRNDHAYLCAEAIFADRVEDRAEVRAGAADEDAELHGHTIRSSKAVSFETATTRPSSNGASPRPRRRVMARSASALGTTKTKPTPQLKVRRISRSSTFCAMRSKIGA